jgi:hypothetical protein
MQNQIFYIIGGIVVGLHMRYFINKDQLKTIKNYCNKKIVE